MMLPEAKTDEIQTLSTPIAMCIAVEYAKKLDFMGIIDRDVAWDPKQCNLRPSQLALSIILSTFTDVRAPLYHIAQNFGDMDVEFLLGQNVAKEDLNDDALGRVLDKIYDAGVGKLYSKVALNCFCNFDIPFNGLHVDTTSISLYGDYKECDSEGYDGLMITEGYSKDHRPDLKQVMVGSVVNEHGIPLYHKTLDGNTADCVWNNDTIISLTELLGDDIEDKFYIADSKAVTIPNLLNFATQTRQVHLLSRCPDNFYQKLASRVKEKAYTINNWQTIGKLIDDSNHTQYEGQEFEEVLHIVDAQKKLHLIPVRLFVYRSDEHKVRVEKRILRETEKLEKAKIALEKKYFACLADANSAANDFLKEHSKSLIDVESTIESEIIETVGRGRIGKQPRTPITKTRWHVKIDIKGANEKRVAKANNQSESFVLITTAPSSKLTIKNALWQYKGQYKVETLFHLLKQPALAARVFLKKPERIEALIMLLQISLLIRSLMQYNAREREKQVDNLPRYDFDNRVLQKPTSQKLLQLLKPIILLSTGGIYKYSKTSELNWRRFHYICFLLNVSLAE